MNTLKKVAIPFTLLLSSTSIVIAGVGHDDPSAGSHAKSNSAPAHWMSPPSALKDINPINSSAQSIAKGSDLYQKNCASCHGKTALGDGMAGMMLNPKPADLRAMSGGHPDGDFAWKIANGRGAMPGWKNAMTEEEIWHTVNYIQSLKGTKVDSSNKKKAGHHSGGNNKH